MLIRPDEQEKLPLTKNYGDHVNYEYSCATSFLPSTGVKHYEEPSFENPSPLGNLHSTCVYARLQCHEN